jgi:ribose transport system substrate-binding protein
MISIRPSMLARGVLAVAAASSLALLAACGSSSGGSSAGGSTGGSTASKGKYVIALSNSFTGNNWRKTMVQVWTSAAQSAQNQGLIKSFKVVNTPDNSATEQISQIQALILQHVNAITIDAASGTALNSVIQQACSAGIKVVVFDSLASAPCEYNVYDNVQQLGTDEGQNVVNGLHGKGNVIVVRGVVGSAPELIDYDAQLAVLKKYPGIKIVGTVVGNASTSQTQQALESVLPSMPKIDGVVDDGVGIGVYDAFQHAGLPIPVFDITADGESLRLFKQLHEKNGLDATAIQVDAGIGSAAFWVALGLLNGQKFDGHAIPKEVEVPLVMVTTADLDGWIAATPPTSVSHWIYTQADADKVIEANITHAALPIFPVPPPGG